MQSCPSINLLPPEILTHILDQCGYSSSKNKSALLQLTTVCKHWHDVLVHDPHFWTTLDRIVKGNEDDARFARSLDQWFARAGQSELNLTLNFEDAPQVANDVHRYLAGTPRWRSLVVKCGTGSEWIQNLIKAAGKQSNAPDSRSPCWPALEELEIHAASASHSPHQLTLPLASIAPSLRKFAFTAKSIESSLFSVFAHFSWTNLTHFDLWSIVTGDHPSFILHILEQAPNLQDLKLVFPPNAKSSPRLLARDQAQITHHKLRRLGIHIAPDVAISLLRHLRLPALGSLDIATRAHGKIGLDEASSAFVHVYRTFVKESECAIKSLRLQWVPRNIEDFNNTIESCQTLECVELEDYGCGVGRRFGGDPMFGFCRLLQDCRDLSLQPLARIKKLSYSTYGFGVVLEEGQEDFRVLKDEPLNWWMCRRFNGLRDAQW